MVDLRLAVRKACYKMATKYQLEPSAMALQSRYGGNFVFSETHDINGYNWCPSFSLSASKAFGQ